MSSGPSALKGAWLANEENRPWLTDQTYLRKRAELFNKDKAEAQYVAGDPMPSSDTVYFTTADSEGNAVSS